MEITSNWPLSRQSIRFLTPRHLLHQLAQSPLATDLYLIAMGHYPQASEHKMQRDNHDNYLLIYCVDGQGSIDLGDYQYPVSSGDLIVIQKDIAHRYASNNNNPWTIYWLHFDGHLADDFCQHLAMARSPIIQLGVQPRLIRHFENLFQLRTSSLSLDAFIHGCQELRMLLCFIAMKRREQPLNSEKNIDLDSLRTFMMNRLSEQLTLDDLAQECRLSKYHFSKRFKALTGHAPIQYFIHLKVERACQTLDSSQLSLKQIAQDLGYEDVYYFSRLFKKVIGLSPEQYRKRLARRLPLSS